jgi:hypothetical protein
VSLRQVGEAIAPGVLSKITFLTVQYQLNVELSKQWIFVLQNWF